jgi:hypothetical protein
MPPMDLASSLRRRQLAREKVKRYWHTGTFDRLAGRRGIRVRRVQKEHPLLWKIGVLLAALLIFGIGLKHMFGI